MLIEFKIAIFCFAWIMIVIGYAGYVTGPRWDITDWPDWITEILAVTIILAFLVGMFSFLMGIVLL